MHALLRAAVPLCAVSIASLVSLPAGAQTAPGGASSAGHAPATSSTTPAPTYPAGGSAQGAGATNAANTGKSSNTAATEALMQRMKRECGAMTDIKARNACEDRYQQQMAREGHLGGRPGQFQHNTEAPGKPQ